MKKRSRILTKKQKRSVIFCIACASLIFLLVFIDSRISPLVEQMAVSRSRNIALGAINQAVYQVIENQNVAYSDLVKFEKDETGRITALQTNIVKINTLKAKITDKILENISQIDVSELSIPLGNIFSGDIFSGRGPKISVRIVPLGSAAASYKNMFTAAGINQTRHQIILECRVSVSVLIPTSRINTEIESEVSIAETIIVGTVPDSYTHIDSESGSEMQDYNDYAR